jgi:hypothetical protein
LVVGEKALGACDAKTREIFVRRHAKCLFPTTHEVELRHARAPREQRLRRGARWIGEQLIAHRDQAPEDVVGW